MRFFAPGLLAVALIAAGCGGGDDDREATPSNGTASPSASPGDATATPSVSPTATPEHPLATPTALPADLPLLQVAAGGQLYEPPAAEFNQLPTVTITIDGEEYTGVLLETLSLKVTADPQAIVNIEGIRSDGIRYGSIRFPLPDIGSTTILVIAENGHLDLISSSIPRGQWLTSVTSVAFQ